MAVTLTAGTAKRSITPEKTDRVLVFGRLPEAVVNDIYARCLVLNDGAARFVIVTYDLNCLDVATPILRERLEKELAIPPSHFVPLATHNHNAPIQIVPDNFDYGHWLADTIFEMIEEAIANEAGPVELKFGAGAADWVRSVGNCPSDYELQVLAAYRDGVPLAVLFTHPTHPLMGAPYSIEPGHPGYACDALEAMHPGCLALYADACGGNQFPLEPAAGETKMEKAQALGAMLADAAGTVLAGPMFDVTGPIESGFHIVDLPLAPPVSREEAAKLLAGVPKEPMRVPYPHPDRWSNWIRVLNHYYEHDIPFPKRLTELDCTDDGFLVDGITDGRKYPCIYEEVIVAKIGPLAFVMMQGEVCTPIGMRIKDAFRQYFPIMVGAYMGEHNLYIPTRELVRRDAYQSQTLRIQYASPVDWDPSVEDVMTDTVIAHVRDIMDFPATEAYDEPYLGIRRGPDPDHRTSEGAAVTFT